MTKVVVNRCFGGFGLSRAARDLLYEMGSRIHATPVEKWGLSGEKLDKLWKASNDYRLMSAEEQCEFDKKVGCETYISIDGTHVLSSGIDYSSDDKGRSDPQLVAVVESLGSKRASDWAGKLEVVEIPDNIDWYIHDYDGQETVEENHRSW